MRSTPGLRTRLIFAAFSLCFAMEARAQFVPTLSGTYDYDNVATNAANWSGGTPNGQFKHTPSGNQTIQFNANKSAALTFNLGGTSPTLTLASDGAGDRTVTLTGDIVMDSSASPSGPGTNGSVQIGSASTGSKLGVDLGGANRNVTVALGDTLKLVNGVTGTGALKKIGAGTLEINDVSSHTGGTSVDVGTLRITADNVLPSATTVAIATGATLDLQGNQTFGDLTGTGTASIANGKALTFTSTGVYTPQFDGVISGAGQFAKIGVGSANLTGANTYTGGTTVSGGTLNALNASGSATGTGTVTINSGAFLQIGGGGTVGAVGSDIVNNGGVSFVRTDTLTHGNLISGSGAVTVTGGATGTIVLTADNTYTGSTTVISGTLQVGNGGASGAVPGNISVNTGAKLVFNRSDAVGYSGVISGGGSLVKDGSGTLTLASAHTFTGNASIAAGKLTIGTTNALPTTSKLSIASGATLDVANDQTIAGFVSAVNGAVIDVTTGKSFTVALGNSSSTYGGDVSGAGAWVINGTGSGALAFTGSAAHTGGTNIGSGATLDLGGGTATGSIGGDVANNGQLTFNRTSSLTYGGIISGSGKVTHSGGATTLSGASTYTGGTFVNGGKLFVSNASGSPTGTGLVTINSGGIFGGHGVISGGLLINAGGKVAPGLAAGHLTAGATTFAGGGGYVFEINDASGTAGTNWDLLSVSGILAVSATSGSPFQVGLSSLTLSNNPGLLTNFNGGLPYSWQFASATGGITGFSAAAFSVDTSSFQNAFTGTFSVTQTGNDLFLNYAPVPEPSTWALMLTGALALAVGARRRGRIR
jgi:fibronectin-binding autotransporter adhesin